MTNTEKQERFVVRFLEGLGELIVRFAHDYEKTLTSGTNRAVLLAQQELSLWEGKKETDERMKSVLAMYWASVGQSVDSFPDDWSSTKPWSAAFICWVVNNAFPGALTPSPSHWVYASNGLDQSAPGKYRTYAARALVPKPGDIVIRTRWNAEPRTVDELRKYHFIPAHGDLVVASPVDGFVDTIGGNLENSVREHRYEWVNEGTGFSDPEVFALMRRNPEEHA